MKNFDKNVIELVAEKLNLSLDYVAWLLSVGNKQALQEYKAAEQSFAADGLESEQNDVPESHDYSGNFDPY